MLELLLSEPRIYAQAVIAWTICIAALVWGGGPERLVAGTWLVCFELGSRVMPNALGIGYRLATVDIWLVSADLLASVSWIVIALYANRNYTLWIAGLQLLALTSHLARGLVEAISPLSYITMVALPGWFQLLFLAAGLSRHIIRRQRYGPYRDWRLASSPLGALGNSPEFGSTTAWLSQGKASWRDEHK